MKTEAQMEDKIKTGLKEIGQEGMDWIDVTQDKGQWRNIMNSVMTFRI